MKKKRIYVFIFAKKNSSRLKGKNLKKIKGKTLVEHSISIAKKLAKRQKFLFQAIQKKF